MKKGTARCYSVYSILVAPGTGKTQREGLDEFSNRIGVFLVRLLLQFFHCFFPVRLKKKCQELTLTKVPTEVPHSLQTSLTGLRKASPAKHSISISSPCLRVVSPGTIM